MNNTDFISYDTRLGSSSLPPFQVIAPLLHAGILQLTCIVGSFMEGQQTRLACSITELRVTFLF